MPYLYKELGGRQGGVANIKNCGPLFNIEFTFTVFYNFSSVFAR
jgi:hypothetical protein